MTDTLPRETFAAALFERGLLIRSGVPGVVGRTAKFEDVALAVERAVDAAGLWIDPSPERVYFPPVVARDVLRRTGYMENFPHLCGSVHAYDATEEKHGDLVDRVREGGDWGEFLSQTAVTLCPAACYPLFPALAGTHAEPSRTFSFTTYVFRNEPSPDPARLQCFRQHEHVFVGAAERVRTWRKRWMELGEDLLRSWGLPVELVPANDMFFGRGGRMMKASQRELDLKHELVVPIANDEQPTAIASFNDHQDHYGHTFGFTAGAAGEVAHTACFGFGLERVTMALLRHNGMEPRTWPAEVRRRILS